VARDLEGVNAGSTSDASHGKIFASGNHVGPYKINPLDDPDGLDFDYLDEPESYADLEEPPPFDLFADDQAVAHKQLLPHQISFREFVKKHRLDPAAFTGTSMFDYDVIRSYGQVLSTTPNVQEDQESSLPKDCSHDLSPACPQDPFTMTSMPKAVQIDRHARIASISHNLVAHLENGDISEQSLNNFLRRNPTMQLQ